MLLIWKLSHWFFQQQFACLCIDTEWDPPEPEPFYQQTGNEQTPMSVGEEKGITVYCVDSGNT